MSVHEEALLIYPQCMVYVTYVTMTTTAVAFKFNVSKKLRQKCCFGAVFPCIRCIGVTRNLSSKLCHSSKSLNLFFI